MKMARLDTGHHSIDWFPVSLLFSCPLLCAYLPTYPLHSDLLRLRLRLHPHSREYTTDLSNIPLCPLLDPVLAHLDVGVLGLKEDEDTGGVFSVACVSTNEDVVLGPPILGLLR